MNPRVFSVKANQDFTLELLFTNNERKIFDVKPYLNFGLFKELNDKSVFSSVHVENGTILWANGLDICPDTLFLEAKKI